MEITEEYCKFYRQAKEVDFLTQVWEKELYTKSLMSAAAWGEKIDRQNKEYKKTHRLIDKYNV